MLQGKRGTDPPPRGSGDRTRKRVAETGPAAPPGTRGPQRERYAPYALLDGGACSTAVPLHPLGLSCDVADRPHAPVASRAPKRPKPGRRLQANQTMSLNESSSLDRLSTMDANILFTIMSFSCSEEAARLGTTNKAWKSKLHEDNFARRLWRSKSIKRWGEAVDAVGGPSQNRDWYKYFCNRSASARLPPECSPLDLIQERYAGDPFRMLSSCILASRTSGGFIIRRVISDFFEAYPSPTDVINGDANEMARILHPLGLNRERTMKRFATDFLSLDLTDGRVSRLHGCGNFAQNSWDVFCHGRYLKVLRDKKGDKNVKSYASYLKRLFAGETVGETPKRVSTKKRKKYTTTTTRRLTRNRTKA